ncbi:hypothetical protein SHKM778_49370 [Streptomyces sp. KM77-8]|uniref:Molybdopterin oxidoreductase domain-containing protein n=1 Tax=Streptomyces haneummycinicus TaxID=3074435 RepID=A0AAT9HML6_9ACTN
MEMIAAAHVHTIKEYGPDRLAGFSPIPAMSMVSHAAGARFYSLLGGAMLSFYDWYADLPVASPQMFGDQTDVPESGDWWDAGYLIMWGSNLPVTCTPDAHWMVEARYRGQKVVAVSPDYADNVKFADEWLAAQPGTDGALAMAMGHVILKEFFVDRATLYFTDYVRKFTDLPFLVALDEAGDEPGTFRPGKFLTAADLGGEQARAEHAEFRTVLLDEATGLPVVPNGTLGDRYGDAGAGKWNLDLGDTRPCSPPRAAGRHRSRSNCPVSTPPTAARAGCGAACPYAGSPGGWSPRSTTCCWPSTASPATACPAGGRPRTTTRASPAPPPGRPPSPAWTPGRRPGSPGSSRPTRRSPAAVR